MGRYRLLRCIGVGGMGEVHRARSYGAEGVTKEVCIKRIRRERLAAPGALDAFVREARLSARLAHPNIVPVFDFGRCGDEYYLAMEWIDGVDLRGLVAARRGGLDDYLVAHVAAEVARALAYAHDAAPDAPIAHRDIKPANVLISRTGDVRIGDFGVALVGDGPRGIAGTPQYMAPEAAEGRADVRSDLFSLGRLIQRSRAGDDDNPLAAIARRLISAAEERPTAAQASAELERYVAMIRAGGATSPRDLLAQRVAELIDDRESDPSSERVFEATESLLQELPTGATGPGADPAPTAPTAEASAPGPASAPSTASTGPAPEPGRSSALAAPPRRRRATTAAVVVLGVAVAGLATIGLVPRAAAPTVPAASSPAAPSPPAVPRPTAAPAESLSSESTLVEHLAPSPAPPGPRPAVAAPRHRSVRRIRPRPAPEAPSPPAGPPGHISLNAVPWARVTVDGEDRGMTPLLDLELASGVPHRVVFTNEVLGAREERTVRLREGQSQRMIVRMEPREPPADPSSSATSPTGIPASSDPGSP